MKCPKCGKEMEVIQLKGCDGLEVDVCDEHGVWLDAGEIKRLIFFDSKQNLRKKRVVKKKLKMLGLHYNDDEARTKKRRAKQLKGL